MHRRTGHELEIRCTNDKTHPSSVGALKSKGRRFKVKTILERVPGLMLVEWEFSLAIAETRNGQCFKGNSPDEGILNIVVFA